MVATAVATADGVMADAAVAVDAACTVVMADAAGVGKEPALSGAST